MIRIQYFSMFLNTKIQKETIQEKLSFLGIAILLLGTSLFASDGGYWQLIYSTDFSTDPGWTTNNPSRFYWVSSDSTYFIESVMGSSDYTYIYTTWNSNSFKLVYDVNILYEIWGSRLGLGLYDPQMNEDYSNYLEPHFGHDDGGKEACLHFSTQVGGGAPMYYGDYKLNTWYTFTAIYDKPSNTATLTVTEKETGIRICSIQATNLGSFSSLAKLGFSMIGTTPYGTRFKGKIDNVYYYNAGPCGDVNSDGNVTVADAVYLSGYIYRGGPPPIGEADVNLDGNITIADANYITGYLYRGGPPPCEPPVVIRKTDINF